MILLLQLSLRFICQHLALYRFEMVCNSMTMTLDSPDALFTFLNLKSVCLSLLEAFLIAPPDVLCYFSDSSSSWFRWMSSLTAQTEHVQSKTLKCSSSPGIMLFNIPISGICGGSVNLLMMSKHF